MKFFNTNSKYDYIYINASFAVLGRNTDIDYGNEDWDGVWLGMGSDLAQANAMAHELMRIKMIEYGIKYAEQISDPDMRIQTSLEDSGVHEVLIYGL